MNQEKIGKYISNKRKELKLTQEQLAEKLGVTDRSVSRWENGKSMPDLSIFKLLCEELNISLEELLSGEDKPKNSNETINYLKYQKKIYKYRIIAIIIILALIIVGFTYYIVKPFRLEFSNSLNYTKLIYAIDSEKKLYSKFDNNYYVKNSNIDLSEALKNGTITIEQIQNQMNYYSSLNDGGTIIYQSKNKKYYLFACNTIEGNKNYYITGNGNDYEICRIKNEKILNHKCLRDKLDNIIEFDTNTATRDNYNAHLITNGNILSWDIYTSTKGTYAIIKTNDETVIEDFKEWFNKNNTNKNYFNIYDNWYIFINNVNDLNNIKLNECIK